MAKRDTKKVKFLIILMQALAGILFFVMGIQGFADQEGTTQQLGLALSRTIGGDRGIYLMIFAVSELLCGGILIASLFALVKTKIMRYALDTTIILWGISICMIDLFGQSFSLHHFDWILWFEYVVIHLILLCVLCVIRFDRG